MTTIQDAQEELEAVVDEALTLAVGRTDDEGTLDARRLLLADDAADALRDQCSAAVTEIGRRAAVPYTANAELSENQCFLIDDEETIQDLGGFRRLAAELDVVPVVTPAELDLSVKLYSVVLGNEGTRTLFVRRTDPQMQHRSGRFLAIGRERLARVDEPTFSFSPGFDFVLGRTWALILHQRSFEILFRQIGLVEQHISTWIGGITTHLPMDDGDIEDLRKVALDDSRTWRRLRDIERRGHLANVSLDDVQEYASSVDLDPDEVVVDGKLVFDPANRFSFLHLLNEDLYRGQLTAQLYEAQRKSSV